MSVTSSQGYNNKPEASFTPVTNQIVWLTYKVLTEKSGRRTDGVPGMIMASPGPHSWSHLLFLDSLPQTHVQLRHNYIQMNGKSADWNPGEGPTSLPLPPSMRKWQPSPKFDCDWLLQ